MQRTGTSGSDPEFKVYSQSQLTRTPSSRRLLQQTHSLVTLGDVTSFILLCKGLSLHNLAFTPLAPRHLKTGPRQCFSSFRFL